MKIVVIGAGSGGYIAALNAARMGARVTLIERDRVGGVCLHHGCIPTKTLYRSRQVAELLKNCGIYGVKAGPVSVELSEVLRRKRMIVDIFEDGIKYLLKAGGVRLLHGEAQFLDKKNLCVSTETEAITLNADAFIIATGSRTRAPGFQTEGSPSVFTAEQMLEKTELPNRMVIIGGGITGVEMAAIYKSFGVDVILVEKRDRILWNMDEEIVNYLYREMEKQGVRVCASHEVERVSGTKELCRVSLRNREGVHTEITANLVLLAAGREGVMESLKLERAGVKRKENFIETDENLRTSTEGIYAIGDVRGGYMLAHTASRQGELLAERLLKGYSPPLLPEKREIPYCIYSFHELAAVGYSEKEAAEMGYPVGVGRFPLSANGKAFIDGADGFVKVVIDRVTQEILGIHMVGQQVSAMIGEAALILGRRMRVEEVTQVIYPHPTMSENIHESCLSAVGSAFHVTNFSGITRLKG